MPCCAQESHVAFALERRTRIDQGEVDVEEHGPDNRLHPVDYRARDTIDPMPDWKDTVNLPRTGFSMKANLQAAEPEALARWEAAGLQQKLEERRRGAPKFVLHDGPPYTNGQIHLGTALNKILKDLVIKSRSMAGFDAPYVPGYDCHGLPIELRVDRELGREEEAT